MAKTASLSDGSKRCQSRGSESWRKTNRKTEEDGDNDYVIKVAAKYWTLKR